ncbi:MAG: serine hydrolase domain-containing protein [Flammeovirgaceae bacterium]
MKAQYLFYYLIILLLSACNANSEESKSNQLTQKLDVLITQEHQANRFDGVVLVGNRTGIVLQKAIGLASREWGIKMKPEHHFDIASVNKSFFAVLVMKAVEQGKLQLSDRLTDVLKTYSYQGSFHPDITIHHLLCHTSGLPDYNGIVDSLAKDNFRAFKRMHFTNAGYVDFMSQLAARFEPGKDFYYSNFAYHLLGIILEDAFQKSFPEILQEHIAQPLDMHATFSSTVNEEVHQQVVGAYEYQAASNSWKKNDFIDLTLGRRIFSTASDLYRWGKALGSEKLLTTASWEKILTNHVAALTDQVSYGYGWVVFDGKGDYQMGKLDLNKPYIIHGGNTGGYKSIVLNVNEGEWVVTILSNIGRQTNELALTNKIVQLLSR